MHRLTGGFSSPPPSICSISSSVKPPGRSPGRRSAVAPSMGSVGASGASSSGFSSGFSSGPSNLIVGPSVGDGSFMSPVSPFFLSGSFVPIALPH